MLCEYGCGKEAKFQLPNGKWCCSESINSCESIRKKNAEIKYVDKKCPHCGLEFKQINVRIFANHVRWCDKNPRHEECCGNEFKKKIVDTIKQKFIEKHGELRHFEVKCDKCGKKFEVCINEKDFVNKQKFFCSSKCAHSRDMTKFKKAHTDKRKTHYKKYLKVCENCGKEFNGTKNSRFCSNKCSAISRNNIIEKIANENKKLLKNVDGKELAELRRRVYRLYRVMCSFNFNIFDYPDEFDLSLIKKCGVYSATNHGGNIHGISRDHMYSVNEAFKNNISPLIVSHPANCRLMIQTDNERKGVKSSITLEELLERIQIWEDKYGKYEKANVCKIPSELFDKIKNSPSCHPSNFGFKIIYNKDDLTTKFWDVSNNPIPEGWTIDCPLEIRKRKMKNTKHSDKSEIVLINT